MMNAMHIERQISPPDKFCDKARNALTRADIIRYVKENGIRMINFRYAGGDGRLKTLNIVIQGRAHLESVLSNGERVDGSSLFNIFRIGLQRSLCTPAFSHCFPEPLFGDPGTGHSLFLLRQRRRTF
ncbi:MAG: hypothetical protein U5N56_09135 [Candidatus Marinimicrobia bacterium]|nr:hypothetical protein [Candidatus Neomarinimicrobiota bacterium]